MKYSVKKEINMTRRKAIILSLVFAVFCLSTRAQALTKEPAGNGWIYETSGISIRAVSVTNNVFRITCVPSTACLPEETGVFVLRDKLTAPERDVFDGQEDFGINQKGLKLRISNKDPGNISLVDKNGRVLLGGGKVILHPDEPSFWELTFSASKDERNYGSGNPETGRSGGLIKCSAQTTVGNGITQVPFIWSTDGYGLLVDYEEKGMKWKKTSGKHYFRVPGKTLDFYIITGDAPYGIIEAYTALTGSPPVPPKWSFGFMMSRWGYKDWDDIREKWHMFRDKNIPVDVFIYDYDWFEKDWKWNNKYFPDPKENVREASSMGIKLVGIRKPRMEDKGNYDYAKSRGWLLEGTKNDLNFSIPDAGKWWWQNNAPAFIDGMEGWWNDEAEQSMTEYHYMIEAQRDGMLALKPGRRVWTINRAYSPGMQRLGAAVWTGDIYSSWDTLRNQPGTLMNYSMSGMVFGGQDIGGFIGLPSPELYVRWIQQGAFMPVMRAHSQQYSDRWPWAFGPEAEEAVKKAIELRYRLIPYVYSYAWQSHATGAPVIRPLFFEFPDDPAVFNMEDEWLFGKEILAAPVMNKGGERTVYLPGNTWHEFDTDNVTEGPAVISQKFPLDRIPLYIPEGSILPLGPVVQHTGGIDTVPLEVHVYPGKDAEFMLYNDDGETYSYEKGEYNLTLLRWEQASRSFTVKPIKQGYTGKGTYRVDRIVLHDTAMPAKVSLNGGILPALKPGASDSPGWHYDGKKRIVEIIPGNLDASGEAKIVALPEAKGGINPADAVKSAIAGGTGDEKFFMKCLKDKNTAVRILAIRGLERLKTGPGPFIKLLNDRDEKVSAAARIVLEKLVFQGNAESLDYFVKKLKKESVNPDTIRVLAYKCNDKMVFDEFRRVLQSQSNTDKITVLNAIKTSNKSGDYFTAIIPLVFDANAKVASAARDALQTYPDEMLNGYFSEPIMKWKVIGPFDNANGKGFANVYPPEEKIGLNDSYEGLGGSIRWKDACADSAGLVDLLNAFPAYPEHVCAYALSTLESKKDTNAQLWVGSDDGVKIWVNGALVWSNDVGRALTKDQDKVKIRLKQGKNTILLKICQGTGAWAFTARLVDSEGGLNDISY
ncbi:MAG: TIM-barrel domain-containing protein [Elusimicrobiota bacterium]